MTGNNINQNGTLVWITGLPGTGKTTLARAVYNLLKDEIPTVFMDGDIFREIMENDLGYTIEDRKANAFRLARMNKYLVEHGMTVVCATVSLFEEVHVWNRENIKNYKEIYIEVAEKLLMERDHKGFYHKAKRGDIENVIGIHQPFDKPKYPHQIITNEKDLEIFLQNADIIAKQLL